MNAVLFLIFCGQAVAIIVWAMSRMERINYFSTLLSISCFAFAFPQLFGLLRTAELFPPGAVTKTLIMTNLCFACGNIGFHMKMRPWNILRWDYTPAALLFISAFLTIVGGVFYFKITRLPDEMLNMGQWSGIVTIYNFFAGAVPCGLVVALYLVLVKRSIPALLLAAFNSLLILDRAVMGGRRSQAVLLLLTIGLSFWLFKRKTVPRIVFLSLAFGGYLFIYSISDYRVAVVGEGKGYNSIFLGGGLGGFKALSNINFLENAQSVTKKGGAEFEAAAFGIAQTEETMSFDFGLSHWNGLVHQFVPAQVLGKDFKESLQFKLYQSAGAFGYEKAGSTSEPGVVDAFRSFWYFGCVKFLLIGMFMRGLLNMARAGNLNFAFLYITLTPSALVIVSHPIDFLIGDIVSTSLFFVWAILLVKIFRPSGLIPLIPNARRPGQEPAQPKAQSQKACSPWAVAKKFSPWPRAKRKTRVHWALTGKVVLNKG